MRLSLYGTLQMTCRLCDNPVSGEQADDERAEVAFYGHVAMAVCPVCGRIMNPRDPVWRAKVRRWLQRRATEEVDRGQQQT
jgi:adenine-specific DNA methylase